MTRKRVSPGEVLDAVEQYDLIAVRETYCDTVHCDTGKEKPCYCGLGLMTMGPWREDFAKWLQEQCISPATTPEGAGSIALRGFVVERLGKDYVRGFERGFDGSSVSLGSPDYYRGYKDGQAVWNKIEAAAKKGKAKLAVRNDEEGALVLAQSEPAGE